MNTTVMGHKAFKAQLKKYYSFYTGGFLVFLALIAVAEQMGMTKKWIGYCFLFATVALYAGIGIMSRTVDAAEYYVAGRRVPAFFNGMATGADWMSAASFIGMAGTLYLSGFDGLAFVMGWTGGYVLVALAAGAVSAQVRAVHDSGLSRRALRRQSSCAVLESLPRSCAPSPMSWRRSMAWA